MNQHDRGGRNTYTRNPRDCGVRALAIVANIPYRSALDALANLGRVQGRKVGITYFSQIEQALNDHGFRITQECGAGTLRTAHKNYPAGVWVLHVRDHFVAMVDGVVYDGEAGSMKRVTSAYRIEEK